MRNHLWNKPYIIDTNHCKPNATSSEHNIGPGKLITSTLNILYVAKWFDCHNCIISAMFDSTQPVLLADTFNHDDVIKWKNFPRYWSFVRGIHRSPVNSAHKDQWRGALMLSLIHAWINGWVDNRKAGDLRRHRAHYDVVVMLILQITRWHIFSVALDI